MEITITHQVKNCHECPYSSNSSQRHDDPFTSAPYPTRWYCEHALGPEIIINPFIIDPKCPVK